MALTKRETVNDCFLRMATLENELHTKGYQYIAGVDEAGRGPLAGPVYAAACILDPNKPILGLNDSKKISEKNRLLLEEKIKESALAWAVVSRDAQRIDVINILEATKEAMTEAIRSLQPKADYILTDAVHLTEFSKDMQENHMQADANINAVAAASILAKTARDRFMILQDEIYPEYGFARHKGYGTKAHYQALDEYGPSQIHRVTFLRSWFQKKI